MTASGALNFVRKRSFSISKSHGAVKCGRRRLRSTSNKPVGLLNMLERGISQFLTGICLEGSCHTFSSKHLLKGLRKFSEGEFSQLHFVENF